MKVRIEHGCTIITTDRKNGDVINKTGIKGLTFYPEQNRYRLNVTYNHRKYVFPFCNSLEEAAMQRKEADKHIADGTFIEWKERMAEIALNKNGIKGLAYRKDSDVYQLNANHNNKRYYLGQFKTIEEAIPVRAEFNKQVKAGTLLEWYEEYKKEFNKKG